MKLSDLDKNTPIKLAESQGFLRALEEVGGVGKIVNGVNTTADVKQGEIGRQASKWGFKTSSNGVPPIARADGKFNAVKVKKMGATSCSQS